MTNRMAFFFFFFFFYQRAILYQIRKDGRYIPHGRLAHRHFLLKLSSCGIIICHLTGNKIRVDATLR